MAGEEIYNGSIMLGRFCRLCAKPNAEGTEKFIYDMEEEQLADLDVEMDLAELINTFLPVKVTRTDPLPKQICELCVEKLKATHEFMVSCVAAEHELRALCEQHEFCVPALKKVATEIPNGDDSLVSTSDLIKVLSTDNEVDNVHENICCPLCYEGKMAIGEDDFNVASEEGTDANKELVEARSLEELLYARHRRANEGLDASDSDASMEPITDPSEIKLTSAREVSTENHKISTQAENLRSPPSRSSFPVHRKSVGKPLGKPGGDAGEEEDDTVMYDDEADEDYEEGADISGKRKKSGRGRGRGRGRGGFRGRGRYPKGKPRNLSENVEETQKDDSLPPQYDETIMWIEGDGDQTLPLVQCLICNRWLPGFEACLQHAVVNHMDEDDDGLTCPRCFLNDIHSHEELIEHFQMHMTISEDPVKQAEVTSRYSALRYSCTLCRKSFSWMLNMLLHPCPGVETDYATCQTCDVNFNSRLRYAFHMQFHAEEMMVLECDVCGQGFATDGELFDHVTLAHLEDNLSCGECGLKFHAEPDLALHALQHTLDQSSPSTCLDCGQLCEDMQSFREHRATHMAVRPYHCDHCGRYFSRHSRFKQHIMSHVYDESMDCWECSACNQVFSDQANAIVHNQAEGHTVHTTVLDKVYRCEFCDMCSSQAVSMSNHRRIHKSLDKPYQCTTCNTSFPSFTLCSTHKSSHHGEDLLVPQPGDFTVPKHFLCGDCSFSSPHWSFLLTHRKMRHCEVSSIVSCRSCPKMFRNHWELLQHQRSDHDRTSATRKKSLECELCGVRYMYQHTLDFHMERKHPPPGEETTPDDRFQCEECGKVFKYQTSLRLHQKMHLGQKNYFCSLCNKGFITKITLRVHMKRSHEGIKSHKCEYCGKAFYHRVTRDDHMRIHTGEKPFQCTYCNVRFRLKSMLTDHVKIHNDDRPYACDICFTRFRRMVHMKQHRMLHTGEKPFQCYICQKAFHLKQELKRHTKMKHQDPVEEEDDMNFNQCLLSIT